MWISVSRTEEALDVICKLAPAEENQLSRHLTSAGSLREPDATFTVNNVELKRSTRPFHIHPWSGKRPSQGLCNSFHTGQA